MRRKRKMGEEKTLVTFVLDVKPRSTFLSSARGDEDIIYNIKYKIRYKSLIAEFIHYRFSTVDTASSKPLRRYFISYETTVSEANLFVYKVKENIQFLFDCDVLKGSSIKLMNEDLEYDYYKNYWKSFVYINKSPRTDDE